VEKVLEKKKKVCIHRVSSTRLVELPFSPALLGGCHDMCMSSHTYLNNFPNAKGEEVQKKRGSDSAVKRADTRTRAGEPDPKLHVL
jgi:hypothetical protein